MPSRQSQTPTPTTITAPSIYTIKCCALHTLSGPLPHVAQAAPVNFAGILIVSSYRKELLSDEELWKPESETAALRLEMPPWIEVIKGAVALALSFTPLLSINFFSFNESKDY
jgi:hypothetical protein